MIWLATLDAWAFIEPADPCLGNLVFVGTVIGRESWFQSAPGIEPRHPDGRIATRFTLSVDLVVVDSTGDAADGVIEISLSGGRIGTLQMAAGCTPELEIGERWSFALNRLPDRVDPHVLGHAWSRVPPEVVLPAAEPLRTAWAAYCGEAAVSGRRSR